jgi:hypothetical protein
LQLATIDSAASLGRILLATKDQTLVNALAELLKSYDEEADMKAGGRALVHAAYHEAGHAVVADTVGLTYSLASIIPNPDDGTSGGVPVEGDDCYWVPPGTDPNSPENEAAFEEWAEEWAEEQALTDYAGHGALVALLGIGDMSDESAAAHGAGADFEKARERIGEDSERMRSLKDLAIAIVAAEAKVIRRIARQLMLRGWLDGDQIGFLILCGEPADDPLGQSRWPPLPRTRARKRAHRCYELCLRGQLQSPQWVIVHGAILVTSQRISVGHAWLELHDIVYDPVKDWFFYSDYYYGSCGAIAHARFSASEAAKMVKQTGIYGPWTG